MSDGKRIQSVGKKVRAKYKHFWNSDLEKIHEAWVPEVYVDGHYACLWDETTISGMAEANSREEALQIARNKRDELILKLGEMKNEFQSIQISGTR